LPSPVSLACRMALLIGRRGDVRLILIEALSRADRHRSVMRIG
jgi:hypothetical protein